MRRILVIFLVWIHSGKVNAYYEFSPGLHQAHTQIIRLRLQEGRELLDRERTQFPENRLVTLYENYIDFLVAFITEEEKYFTQFKKNNAERIKQLEKNGNKTNSPYHHFAIAEMTLQDAMLKVKYQENISAATEIRKAYKMIEKNSSVYPAFVLNKKLSGFIHTLIGSVPKEYRWLTDLVGMTGTVSGGTQELKKLYHQLDGTDMKSYREELLFYLSNIHNTFSSDELEARELLDLMKPFTFANPLLRYCYGNTALKWGRNEDALKILKDNEDDKGSFPFYYLNYKRGLTLLRKLDLKAEKDFQFFLASFGGMNHRKSVNQKLAWLELLRGNKTGYHAYMKNCLSVGSLNVDEDKEAYREASSGDIPNLYLLRSRLLFDGGYCGDAWLEITRHPPDSFPRFRDKLEMTYRLARIMEKLNYTNKAIHYYSQTLRNGSSSTFYFAANSALLLGNLSEKNGEYDKAISYYEQCLSLRGHEYQNSIDQKAQAGIERIRELRKRDAKR